MKVNGWLEQLTFARSSKFMFDLIEPQRQKEIAPGEGLGLLENWLGCTLPESQQEDGLSVGAVGPQGASRWRDYPRRSVRARSFAP